MAVKKRQLTSAPATARLYFVNIHNGSSAKATGEGLKERRPLVLRDIATIKVQGANFASLTSLDVFEPRDGKDKQENDIFKTVKGALLYGRNGTGKSTIARAFRKAKGEPQPAIKQTSFSDKDGKPVILSEEEKKRIFVFDEDFVNEKVKLKEDHLDTIIMLGQAADLSVK